MPNAVISGYQWQSSSDGGTTWTNIAGATASTYTPVEADETHLLRVVETATDSGTAQSGTSTSAATAAVTDIVLAFTTAASISGSATVGSVLTAVKGALNDSRRGRHRLSMAVLERQRRHLVQHQPAPPTRPTPRSRPIRAILLRVIETATDADGGPSTTSTSAATSAVTNNTLVFTTPPRSPARRRKARC